ncbi:homeobox protein NANOG-like isoform X2 [Carlito syrichta]|uniref:Homeobox protein NANOG-like isoform X2 n=1 Tax=Carlito syrichta TaxID=1868482 RepID=A0A3Q0DLU3_CARSF|nr:homeobox protein NANOG-like isoform X2 [Carlito syrichta]
MPVICGPEENYPTLPMSSAEMPHTETVSPLPSSMDLLAQDSPDSSTSPKVKLPTCGERSPGKKEADTVPVKKQKTRTVFTSAQLCVLSDRFQRQKYLSLQQMQELSSILNLSYKQVKTWFQNQRMKSKRWQKSSWPKNSYSVAQGCLVNTSGNLPGWNNQTWNSQSWSSHTWNSQTWCPPAWNSHTWSSPFHNSGEESLQAAMQFQQNSLASDLEATLEMAGESHSILQQATKCFNTPQAMDLFHSYFMDMQPEDL